MKRWKRLLAAALALGLSMGARAAMAQQDPASPDQGGAVAVGTETWYTQPWVWIVMGAALLLVLLALALRRDRSRS